MRSLFFLLFFTGCIFGQLNVTNLDTLKNESIEDGVRSFFDKNSKGVKNSYSYLLSLFNENKDSLILAKHYQYKAMYYELEYKSDSAFYFYHQSKNISKAIGDSLEVGRRLLSIAILQRESKDFLGSEISSIESLQYLEPIKSYKYLQNIYSNLGIVSEELNQKKDALRYYDLSLEVNSLNEKSNRKERCYLHTINNIGFLYQKRDEHNRAIEYFLTALKFDSIKYKYPLNYALLLENLSFSQDKQRQSNTTLGNYQKVLKIRERYKEEEELSTTHINISNYYIKTNEYVKAKFHANEALKYAKQTHNNKRWLEALENLSQLTRGEKSKRYLQEYITLNDSLIQKERGLKNQFAKIRYETDKKEKENGLLKIENEKNETEIIYHKQQKTIGWLLFIVSLFALGFSVLFFVVRRRRLIYQNQLQKAQAREKERQQIAKSLHDEVAGDLRMLHQKLQKSNLLEEAKKLDEVKDNVRNLSHKLSSVSFEKVSFKDQVINLVSDYFEPNFRIIVTGINDQEWKAVNPSIKRLLYLSIRESIQNCKKYAKASKMTIHFSIHKKNVFLNIEDNGIGFDTNTTKKGIGLQNLEERLEELNGTLAIESEPNNGAKIHVQIPLNA